MAMSKPEVRALLDGGVSPGAPQHVAIIMDGNGRWAAARGLPRVAGHRAGAQAVRRTIEAAVNAGVGLRRAGPCAIRTGPTSGKRRLPLSGYSAEVPQLGPTPTFPR